jgi:hypothetical protein
LLSCNIETSNRSILCLIDDLIMVVENVMLERRDCILVLTIKYSKMSKKYNAVAYGGKEIIYPYISPSFRQNQSSREIEVPFYLEF